MLTFLILFGSKLLIEFVLLGLNQNTLHGHGEVVPDAVRGQIDPVGMARARDYAVRQAGFRSVVMVLDAAILLGFIFSGAFAAYDTRLVRLGWPWWLHGWAFFAGLSLAQFVLGLPGDAYRVFRLENRFGFTTQTWGSWGLDQLKALALSLVIMSGLVLGGLWLIQIWPRAWWLTVWLLYTFFSWALVYLSPVVLEPLFNRFTPLDEALAFPIRTLMAKAGVEVQAVFQMDASRRSRHTNAYFTGIGRSKRIVLYDTLLEKLGPEQVQAVLAHEAGHWKLHHVGQRMMVSAVLSLLGLGAAFMLLQGDGLERSMGLGQVSFFGKVLLLGIWAQLLALPLGTALNAWSRRHERQADDFAASLTGRPETLAQALVQLSKDNLSNLHPHPWYVMAYYSHPPLVQRLEHLAQAPRGTR